MVNQGSKSGGCCGGEQGQYQHINRRRRGPLLLLPWTWLGVLPRQTLGLPIHPIRIGPSSAWRRRRRGGEAQHAAVGSACDPPPQIGAIPSWELPALTGASVATWQVTSGNCRPPCIGNPGLPIAGAPGPSGPVPRPQPVRCSGGRDAAAPRLAVWRRFRERRPRYRPALQQSVRPSVPVSRELTSL